MHTTGTTFRFGLAPLTAAATLVACAATNGVVPTAASSTAAIERQEAPTLAEAKLDSRLLDALDRVAAGGAPASDRNPLDLDVYGRVLVDMTAIVTVGLLQHIEAIEGIVVSQFPQYESIRARLPFDRLLTLAERADVKFKGQLASALCTQDPEGRAGGRRRHVSALTDGRFTGRPRDRGHAG